MKLFKHHPDGYILITSDDKTYEDTLDNFIADLGHTYSLPAGQILRVYQPTEQHYVSDGNNQTFLSSIWDDGDNYFTLIDSLNIRKAIRNKPIPLTFLELQEVKWNYIKSCRDAEERLPLPYLGKLLDFDEIASKRLTWAISTATVAKLAGQSFNIDWTTSDGSVLTLTENDILGIPIAVATRSNTIHQKARGKADEITVATTAEQLDAITW